MMKRATLILDDGSRYDGFSFGYDGEAVGEVVFNTAMTGYPESLTDPSYAGQILTLTYPLVGNYGVPTTETGSDGLPLLMESERIHVKGLVVADYCERYSHWNARESLGAWLKRERIPAITGIDTRRLTMALRERGVMMGRIETHPQPLPVREGSEYLQDYGSVNWVEQVACREVITYNRGAGRRVVLVDCGVKANIIRCLIRRGVEVVRVPWDYDFNQLAFDGLFLANGPGDPERCEATVEHIRAFLRAEEAKAGEAHLTAEQAKGSHPPLTSGGAQAIYSPPSQGGAGGESLWSVRPLMGICLGNQLLARATGAKTYKLKYGHRSHNQPVRQVGTDRCFITSQNHGYAVDDATLPPDWEPLFQNMNDGSNEGIRHKRLPWFSAQFHPEACSGPTDTEFLFDRFVESLG